MEETQLREQVLRLIADAMPPRRRKSAVTPDMRLQRDLGIDSMALLALVFRFEQTFGIDLSKIDPSTTVGQMHTVGDVLRISREVIDRTGAAPGA